MKYSIEKIQAAVMEIIGLDSYLKGEQYDLEGNNFLKTDSDFTGVVLFKSFPQGEFIRGYRYVNGIRSGLVYEGQTASSSGLSRSKASCVIIIEHDRMDCVPSSDGGANCTLYRSYTTLSIPSCGGGGGGLLGSGSGLGGGESVPNRGGSGGGGIPPDYPEGGNEDLKTFFPVKIDTSLNKYPCAKSVITKIRNMNGAIFDTIINKIFGESKDYTLTFRVSSMTDTSVAAVTHSLAPMVGVKKGQKTIYHGEEISFQKHFLEHATRLAIAATAFHESLHAYIDYKFYTAQNNQERQYLVDKFSFINLKKLYKGDTSLIAKKISNFYKNSKANSTQHEIMAQRYISVLTTALKDFSNQKLPDKYFTALSWGGLQYTTEWETLAPSDTIYYHNVNYYEGHGKPKAKGKKCD